MRVYHDMIQEVFTYGTRKENRTGVDTLSTFNFNYELCWDEALYGRRSLAPLQYDHRYVINQSGKDGWALPLLTTKEILWKNIVAEMLWFLSGQTNISILQRHGCKFWDPWANSSGEVPSAYGNFWRRFPVHGTRSSSDMRIDGDDCCSYNDQIEWAVKELRSNPMSRRVVISAWAPGNAQYSKLPPCHLLFVFNVQNVELPKDQAYCLSCHTVFPAGSMKCIKCGGTRITEGTYPALCLHLTQRSCDLFLGVPYNMASYGLLLLIFSHLTGIQPGIFSHTLLDLHIYTAKPDGSKAEFDHIPVLKEQLDRSPRQLPRLSIDPSIKELSDIEALMRPDVSTERLLEVFALRDYDPWPALKGKVAV